MRKFAYLKEPLKFDTHENVVKVMLYEADEGFYLFGYCGMDSVLSSFDCLYDSPEHLYEDWDGLIDDRGWIGMEDPLPGCQHDAFIPIRVKGRNTGKPEWGKFETLRDGEWIEYHSE